MRALAKIMDFLRAVSIILVGHPPYWYCYEAVRLWGIDIGVVDRVLINFDRTASLFHTFFIRTLCVGAVGAFLPGTKGVKEEKITWGRIWMVLAAGLVLFFLNWWILSFAFTCGSQRSFLCGFDGGGLCLPAHGRHMDEPSPAHQPHG